MKKKDRKSYEKKRIFFFTFCIFAYYYPVKRKLKTVLTGYKKKMSFGVR